jgi:4-amino-4-deoxy-L-arabinose transferase-like glycosyltransferase
MTEEMITRSAESPSEPRFSWRVLLLLAAITLLALGLRLYRLSEQSAWIDEFQIAGNMNAPDFHTYAALAMIRAKDNVPLYYIFLYYWYHLFGEVGLYSLRVPAVLCNVACVPLLYLLTRSAFGRKAGLIAALCLALSPTQIWYAQSIRVNAFLGLVVLISMWVLLRALSVQRWRWWLALSAVNLLAVWTHPFAVFFVCVECLSILWWFRARILHAALLTGVQALICLSIFAFLYQTLPDAATPEEDFSFQMIPLKSFLADWVADDAAMTAEPFTFQGGTWGFLPDPVQRFLFRIQPCVDWFMIVFLGGCVLWCLGSVLRGPGARTRCSAPPGAGISVQGAVLLLSVALLPLLIHLALSVVWRPILLQRFTSYSALAVYSVIGSGITLLGCGVLRRGALTALLMLYAFQLSLSLPAVTRTDYRAAHRHITANAGPEDPILVSGTFVSWEAYRFNAGPSERPILPAYSLASASEKAARWLAVPEAAADSRTAWVVIEPFVFTLPPLTQFEQDLSARGLTWSCKEFAGMNKLYVYRISPGGPPGPPVTLTAKTDYEAILSDLGYTSSNAEAHKKALIALRMVWDVEFTRSTLYYTMLAMRLSDEGCLDLAMRAAEHACALNPRAAFAHFAFAIVLGESNQPSRSREAFDRATATDLVGYTALYEPLLSTLYWSQDTGAARAHLEALDRMYAFLPLACYARAGVLPLAAQLRVGS